MNSAREGIVIVSPVQVPEGLIRLLMLDQQQICYFWTLHSNRIQMY